MPIKPPEKLNSRHRSLALLVATGTSLSKAADQIGLSKSWASAVGKSPLFQALVDHFQQEIESATLAQAKEKLFHEALASVNTVTELRDTSMNESVRLSAAKDILDRTIPKVTRNETDQTVHITFDEETEARIRSSLVTEQEATILPDSIQAARILDTKVRLLSGAGDDAEA